DDRLILETEVQADDVVASDQRPRVDVDDDVPSRADAAAAADHAVLAIRDDQVDGLLRGRTGAGLIHDRPLQHDVQRLTRRLRRPAPGDRPTAGSCAGCGCGGRAATVARARATSGTTASVRADSIGARLRSRVTTSPATTHTANTAAAASRGAVSHTRRWGVESWPITRARNPAGGSVRMMSRTTASIASSSRSPFIARAS